MLNLEKIKRTPYRISKIKPFINKYNWNGIKYPSKIYDWKTVVKNNPTIAFNILYIREKEIYPGCISKHKKKCEKPVKYP